jgi:hypothetical protein
MISEEKILQLAWREQLNVWGREKEIYEKTESNVARRRTEKAWEELKEIENIIREKGYNA